MSSMFSIMFLSLTIALFFWRIYKRRRIDPSNFRTGTNLFNQDIHPFTSSLMLSFNNRFSAPTTSGVIQDLLIGCETGVTDFSLCNYSLKSFNKPDS